MMMLTLFPYFHTALLVGLNDEKRELVVGIVDFIGRYTTFKALENQTKSALKGASFRNLTMGRVGLAIGVGTGTTSTNKEDTTSSVTVLPPAQYKDRFVRAMEQYFVTVPGMTAHYIRIPSPFVLQFTL